MKPAGLRLGVNIAVIGGWVTVPSRPSVRTLSALRPVPAADAPASI
jgi:hypothetical protein